MPKRKFETDAKGKMGHWLQQKDVSKQTIALPAPDPELTKIRKVAFKIQTKDVGAFVDRLLANEGLLVIIRREMEVETTITGKKSIRFAGWSALRELEYRFEGVYKEKNRIKNKKDDPVDDTCLSCTSLWDCMSAVMVAELNKMNAANGHVYIRRVIPKLGELLSAVVTSDFVVKHKTWDQNTRVRVCQAVKDSHWLESNFRGVMKEKVIQEVWKLFPRIAIGESYRVVKTVEKQARALTSPTVVPESRLWRWLQGLAEECFAGGKWDRFSYGH